jgi:hypothetical protein
MVGLEAKSGVSAKEVFSFSSSVFFRTDTSNLDESVLTISDLRRKLSNLDFLPVEDDDFVDDGVTEDELELLDDKICLKIDVISWLDLENFYNE